MNPILEKKIAEFRVSFISDFKAKLSLLIKMWSEARTTQTLDTLKPFRFEVHSLRGSSGTLSFLELSTKLGVIENQIAPCEKDFALFQHVIDLVDQQMNDLIRQSELSPNPLLLLYVEQIESAETKIEPDKEEITSQSYRDISIALLDNDEASSAVTIKLLTGFGFKINAYKNISFLQQAISNSTFKLILIDIENTQDTTEDIFKFCLELNKAKQDVFILSTDNSFTLRLNAIRAKVNNFLLKPVNITTLVSKIRKNFKLDFTRPYRVLLLDDQASVGTFYKTLLENEGVQVLAINDAEKIMTELDSFHPDVFLLDMHMPNISGLEVAKLLRQQAKYDYVPIIFLSSDDDVDTKLEVLECGADDIISKSTAPNIIVQQIDSRIQRGQEIRYLASRDSLTGVLNHGQIMDAAAHALRMSTRQTKPTIVVMIDLDNFKSVNDKYGHLGGDKVLISLGQLLLQSVRDTDYVGRYGGEEFMVVFNEAELNVIEHKMNSILTAFSHLNYSVDTATFNCSFSAGLASSEHYDKLSELIAAADGALYEAKEAGRNRVNSDKTLKNNN